MLQQKIEHIKIFLSELDELKETNKIFGETKI
jgi:FtsZ-binding cell division protein ZapB